MPYQPVDINSIKLDPVMKGFVPVDINNIKMDAPEPPANENFFQRMGSDYNKRVSNAQSLANQGISGKQTMMETYPEMGAQLVAGPISDFGTEAIRELDKQLGGAQSEGVSEAAHFIGLLPSFGGDTIGERIPGEISAIREAHPRLSNAADAIGTTLGAVGTVTGVDSIAKGLGNLKGVSMQGTLEQEAKSAPKALSASEEAFKNASKAYAVLDASNTTLTPQGVQNVVAKAKEAAGLDPQAEMVFPGEAGKTLQRLQGLADNGESVKIQTLHRIVKKLGQAVNKHFREGLDEDGMDLLNIKESLLSAAQDPEGLSGNISNGFDAWNTANEYYAIGSRLEDAENVMKRSALMKNPAASMQTGFRQLLMNAKKTRGWTDEQMAALEHVADTGQVGDLLQTFSTRLIPAMSAAAGGSVGGIPGAIVSGVVGQGAASGFRAGATALQAKRAEKLMDLLGETKQQAMARALLEKK